MRPRKHNRHLPPCCYYRHGAYYHVKGGKWTRLGADLSTALHEYARLASQPIGGMAQLIESHIEAVCRGKAPATQHQYRTAARKLQAIMAEFAPHQVTPRVVAQMRRGLSDTPNMANRCLTVLRLVFDLAVEAGTVEANPCTGIKRLPEAKRDRLIQRDELQRIRAQSAPRLQVMIDVAYLTGQRLMDVVNISRHDLKPEGIYFRQDKTDAQLIIRWTAELREAVERAKALPHRIGSVFLFSTRNGRPPSYRTVYDQWRAACNRAGVTDTDLRDIRAMSATQAEQQGIDPTALLGHTSPAMTRRYLRDRTVPVVDGPSFGRQKDIA